MQELSRITLLVNDIFHECSQYTRLEYREFNRKCMQVYRDYIEYSTWKVYYHKKCNYDMTNIQLSNSKSTICRDEPAAKIKYERDTQVPFINLNIY